MFDPLRFKTRVVIYTVIGFVLGVGGASAMGWASPMGMAVITQVPQVSDAQIQPALDLSEAFVNIAEAVTPGVVRIEAEQSATEATESQLPIPLPDEFRQFFDGPNQVPPGERPPQMAGGSGFIVSPDGYILTNDHVVGDATSIRVFLPDRREYTAEIVGSDPTTDVAVIKIDDANLPVLSLGSSANLRVGEWILAVGNPGLGGGSRPLDYTVTSGIVSAIGRPLNLIGNELRQEGWEERSQFAIEDFIQTDAVINPGNSGGPMVNLRGQVVGINSAIASRTGYYQGYGFAVPVDLAKRIMEDLIEFGEVRRAYLGIEMREVQLVDAEYYGLPRAMGVLVNNAVPDSPAVEAGLRQEDVIVAVDGVDVERPGQLQLLIAQHRPGDEVMVRFYRNRERQEVTVQLGTSPLGTRPVETTRPTVSSQTRIGIDVMPLDESTAEQFGYEAPGGVVIGRVSPAGPAGRAGIRQGMRLVDINRESVGTVQDVEELLGDVEPGDIVSLRMGFPDGSSRIVNLRVPQ